MNGKIHSFQSLGAVDGPGLRTVVFMQGCPLRCAYCHNPDTWDTHGKEYSANEVFEKIMRYKPYIAKNGGVTLSGGEPLLQYEFVTELFRLLRGEGIHTALDTSGVGDLAGASAVLQYTDLVLCDLKFPTESGYLQYCKGSMKPVLEFLKLTEEMRVPLWIRHVVVPSLTDSQESILQIASLAKQFSNVQKLELLPFRKICSAKYSALGIPFPMENYEECSQSKIQSLYKLIEEK
jgi:pyruvate formate lyase activating enzyme